VNISISINKVKPSPCAQNLGAYFKSSLSFKPFVQYTAATVTFHIHPLDSIQNHLLRGLLSRLYASLRINRLDYRNAVLTGLSKCSFRPLQLVLNMAARLVYKARRSRHVSPLLNELPHSLCTGSLACTYATLGTVSALIHCCLLATQFDGLSPDFSSLPSTCAVGSTEKRADSLRGSCPL